MEEFQTYSPEEIILSNLEELFYRGLHIGEQEIAHLRELAREIAAEAGLLEVAEQSRPIDFCYKVQDLAWKTLPHTLFSYACRAMYAYYFRSRYGV